MKKLALLSSLMLMLVFPNAFAQDKKTAYAGNVEFSYLKNISEGQSGKALSLTTTQGAAFLNKRLQVGVGTGYMISATNDDSLIPAFADVKYRFLNDSKRHAFTPFVMLRGGGLFDLSRVDNAWFLLPCVGFEVFNFFIKAGYQYTDGYSQVKGERIENVDYSFHSVTFSVGINF